MDPAVLRLMSGLSGAISISTGGVEMTQSDSGVSLSFGRSSPDLEKKIWEMYQQRVVTLDSSDKSKPEELLEQAITHLTQAAPDSTITGASFIEKALAIQNQLRATLLKQVNKDGRFKIEGHTCHAKLDPAIRTLTQALWNRYRGCRDEKRLDEAWVALCPILTTSQAKSAVWDLANRYAEQKELSSAFRILEESGNTLEVTVSATSFCNTVMAHCDEQTLTDHLVKMRTDTGKSSLAQAFCQAYVSAGKLTEAKKVALKIRPDANGDDPLIALANAFWSRGSFQEAYIIRQVRSSSKRNDWFTEKANQVWIEGNRPLAEDLIWNIDSDSTRKNWYEEKATQLWYEGSRDAALTMIRNIHSDTTRDDWYKDKATELWYKKEMQQAYEIVDCIISPGTKSRWIESHPQ